MRQRKTRTTNSKQSYIPFITITTLAIHDRDPFSSSEPPSTSFAFSGRYYAEKSRYQEQLQEASAASAAAGAAQAGASAGDAGAAAAAQGGAAGAGAGKTPGGARQGGVYNHGMDDEHFDYIVHEGEVFQGRYSVRETIGKGEEAQEVVDRHVLVCN